MVDNLDITPGTGRTIATDQVAGVDYQRVKAVWGADGTVTDVDVASGSPLPVQVRSATGLIPIGEPTDDKSAATDTTSVSGISIWKQISASIQAAAASLAGSLTVSGTVSITDISQAEYETVAASQTAQVLGATGGTGDYISGLLVIPATTSPGNVLLLDNATSITVFTGGSTSVSNLVPFFIPLGMKSVSGAWKVTTGANVSVIGIGNFT